MHNRALEKYLNELLTVEQYKDYAPNGLQIEGSSEVNTAIFGVTASMELIEQAIEKKVDAIIVHHGYFWKGEQQTITGIKKARIQALLANNINLFAYHLPLDGHEVLGNNAQLGQLWQVESPQPTAPFSLMWTGDIEQQSADNFCKMLTETLGRKPFFIPGGKHPIRHLAWCSGGAQGALEQAAELGVDAFVSGEVSEKTYHEAREYGVHYFAAGHHATERGGIMALAKHLNHHTDVECQFIDCWNPV